MAIENDYVRPFGPNAPWNIPVENLILDQDSDQLARMLWNDSFTDRDLRNFNINNTSYTYPVYEVTDDTPYYKVVDHNGWGNLGGTKIPFDPSWKPAPGSDGQIIILDPETGREWDLWQVDFDGSKVHISNGNLVSGMGGSDSYFDREVGFEPSRGAGIPYLAMLVRPEEIAAGRIEHALSMPIQNTSTTEAVYPATKIEQKGNPDGIPEGTRYALDVTYAQIDAHLDSLPDDIPQNTLDGLRVIMVAMKEYGWFITDTAGSTHFQLESTTSARAEWRELGFLNEEYGYGVYPRDGLDGLILKNRIVAYAPSDEQPVGNGQGGDGQSGGDGQTGGDNGIDTIMGSVSSDTLRGDSDAERFLLRAGGDRAFGEGGNDILRGNAGGDSLNGGAGDDSLYGGKGRDVLAGNGGRDRLFGGDAKDRFVYKSGWDVDQIADFDARGGNHDVLDLRGLDSVRNWVDLVSNHMTQNGGDVVIDGLRGDKIILSNVNIADLDAGEFMF